MRPDGVTDEELLRRAGKLLRHRVDAYSDRLSDEMLGTLTQLVALRDSVDAALSVFVTACRRVAFDPSLPRTDPEPPPEANTADIHAVIDALGALERVVHQHADGQEWVDALSNAHQYRTAARGVRDARDQLAACVRAD